MKIKPEHYLLGAAAAFVGYKIYSKTSTTAIGKTLKEFSASYPGSYKVTDFQEQRGDIKSWDDNIQIYDYATKKTKQVKRRSAYNVG